MKKNEKIIPALQMALLAGVAGVAVNKLVSNLQKSQSGKADYKKLMKHVSPDATVDVALPKAVADMPVAGTGEQEEIKHGAEKFVEEHCPYLSPENDQSMRYYIVQNINIGRFPHNDIQLSDKSVSRVHCRIFISKGVYYLADMGAAVPAQLNGTPVENFKPQAVEELYQFPLRDGDRILIGRSVYLFRMPGEDNRASDETFRDIDGTVRID